MTLHKWTIARRGVQVLVIALIASPLFGVTFFQGNLSAGTLFGIGLADPLAFLQALVAGRVFVASFLGAALLISVLYVLLGGRTFCGWVCPVYLLTELGEKAGRRLGTGERFLPLKLIRWSFCGTLVVSLLSGVPFFEVVSPIGITTRAVMFKAFMPLLLVASILLVEIFVARRVWCRSLCPAGGFYSLLGRFSPLRIGFERARCTDCVCPVAEVLTPALVEDRFRGLHPLRGLYGRLRAGGPRHQCRLPVNFIKRQLFITYFRRSFMKMFIRSAATAVLAAVLLLPAALFAEEPENYEADAQRAESEPPVIPHPVADAATGKDCLTCHSTGLNGAPQTPHPNRLNCTQCHVRSDLSDPKKARTGRKAKKDK